MLNDINYPKNWLVTSRRNPEPSDYLPSADVFEIVSLVRKVFRDQFPRMGPKKLQRVWSVEAMNHDMVEISFDRTYEQFFEEAVVDVINENGWHISSRDFYDNRVVLSISPDEGMALTPPPPLVLYHITLASNLPKIRRVGLVPSTGVSKHHEISYTPRVFLTATPNSIYGISFPKAEPLAIVAVKTWMLPPDMIYQQDPQFSGRGYDSCFVTETIPPEALVFPTRFPTMAEFNVDEDVSLTKFVPEVGIPKRVQAQRIYELAQQSPTPAKTAFFNIAGSLLDKTSYHKSRFFQSKLGQKFDHWLVDNIAESTPTGHPWNEGPVFRY